MLGNLNGWHLVILIAVVLLLFGAPKLPGLARSIGQSMRIFRSEVKHDEGRERRPASWMTRLPTSPLRHDEK